MHETGDKNLGEPHVISSDDAPLILNELKTLNYEGQLFVTENDMACFDRFSSLPDALKFCGFTTQQAREGIIVTGWKHPNVSLMSPTIIEAVIEYLAQ